MAAGKKKGLSLDDKRTKMLQLLYEKKTFFQLRELEKIAPKEKGITSMSVKQVVQSLVDDGLVDSDKIGVSTYFWAFPSKALIKRQNRTKHLEESIDQVKASTTAIIDQVEKASIGKDDNEERYAFKKKMPQLIENLKKLNDQLAELEECDPETIEEQKNQTATIVKATNRWTENVFSAVSFIRNHFNIPEKDIYQQFEIPEEFDYI